MRVLYIDLNELGFEDYSRNSKRYGGGRAVASYLMPYLNDHGHYMEIWGAPECFDNMDEKHQRFCRGKSWEIRKAIGEGSPLKNYLAPEEHFDIVLHHFGNKWINCEGLQTKSLYWAVGYGEEIHPGNERIILYNDYQSPRAHHMNPKFYRARIGVPIPEFQEYKKEPYIFGCYRQVPYFGAHIIAQICKLHRIKYYAAGPLDQSLDFMSYVDNEWVNYLGVIDEETKIDYQKRARLSCYLHSWSTPFNLSAIQSLAYGTPIVATNTGFWPSLVKHGMNGFLVHGANDVLTAWKDAEKLSQRNCWESIQNYSADKMIEDYVNVFNQL